MNVGGGVGQMNGRGRSRTLGAKQRRSEFFSELAVRTGREQIVWSINISHGHWSLLEIGLTCSCDLQVSLMSSDLNPIADLNLASAAVHEQFNTCDETRVIRRQKQ